MSLAGQHIGFVGGGAMAEALLGGLVAAGVEPRRLRASEPEASRRTHLETTLGIGVGEDNAELASASDVVVLAVKPGVVPQVLGEVTAAGVDPARPLWISIAAGVTLATLEGGLRGAARVVRAMPNTPALVGTGATGICGNAAATDADLAVATALFEGVGLVWTAPEEGLLDAVTGLSGSGPAYVFAFLEALIEAGVENGLPREAAERLSFQTVLGAARLAIESDKSPGELRQQVSSPGGTTLAGLARLGEEGFSRAIRAAVAAATARAAELGREGSAKSGAGPPER
ncbi:MAG: pyrroline-5-carboxylate reductase [Myxococcota bacterium]|nr:pyrroline-5-carboxylate reductase [Myxococcota bacterium]